MKKAGKKSMWWMKASVETWKHNRKRTRIFRMGLFLKYALKQPRFIFRLRFSYEIIGYMWGRIRYMGVCMMVGGMREGWKT